MAYTEILGINITLLWAVEEEMATKENLEPNCSLFNVQHFLAFKTHRHSAAGGRSTPESQAPGRSRLEWRRPAE